MQESKIKQHQIPIDGNKYRHKIPVIGIAPNRFDALYMREVDNKKKEKRSDEELIRTRKHSLYSPFSVINTVSMGHIMNFRNIMRRPDMERECTGFFWKKGPQINRL